LGCGWLGLPLASSLISKGFNVKGSTTSLGKLNTLKSAGITPFLIDINLPEKELNAFLNSEVLIIAITNKNSESFKKLISKIELSPIKKLLFISSTSVYDNNNGVVTEDTPINKSPLSAIEHLFVKNTKFKTTILRFGGLFGYHRNPGAFFKNGLAIENPEGTINLIHRDDCINIIEQIILKKVWGECFNACADSHPKRREFYTKKIMEMGVAKLYFNENSANDFKIVSSEKLKSKIGFHFKSLLSDKKEANLMAS